ncbi:hypothetical protein ZWY2020_057338 [Hordeum vulgare]|nr:hypothetical protein ZWY2020_057338 [Hordeum vulgare]
MAARLLAGGYAVTAYARTPAKAVALVAAGASLADSPASVAAASDVVFTMVGNPGDVRAVVLDAASGALAGLRPGGVFVDCTSSPPPLRERGRRGRARRRLPRLRRRRRRRGCGRLARPALGAPRPADLHGPRRLRVCQLPDHDQLRGRERTVPVRDHHPWHGRGPSLVPSPLGSTAGYKYVKRLQDTQHTASSKHPFN